MGDIADDKMAHLHLATEALAVLTAQDLDGDQLRQPTRL
jgi:hypothetical protein